MNSDPNTWEYPVVLTFLGELEPEDPLYKDILLQLSARARDFAGLAGQERNILAQALEMHLPAISDDDSVREEVMKTTEILTTGSTERREKHGA